MPPPPKRDRASNGNGRRKAGPELPVEIWLSIFHNCDIKTLWHLRTVNRQFLEIIKPLLVHRLFCTYPVIWRLFRLTYDKFVDMNSCQDECDGLPSPTALINSLMQMDTAPKPPPSVSFAPSLSPPQPPTLAPAAAAPRTSNSPQLRRRLFSTRTIHPFALRIIHLMHKNIPLLTDQLMMSSVTTSRRDSIDLDELVRLRGEFNALSPSATAGEDGFHFPTSPILTTTAPHGTASTAASSEEPEKYTDHYESWCEYDAQLTGIEREVNYQRFRSEVGRRGSGVLSREYVQWEQNRRDIMRQLAVMVARLWCVLGQRRFPFSHVENKAWKERRIRRGVPSTSTASDGNSRARSRSMDLSPASPSTSSGRRRAKSQNLGSGGKKAITRN